MVFDRVKSSESVAVFQSCYSRRIKRKILRNKAKIPLNVNIFYFLLVSVTENQICLRLAIEHQAFNLIIRFINSSVFSTINFY